MDAPCKNVKLRDPPSHLECVETLDLGANLKTLMPYLFHRHLQIYCS